MTDELYYSLLLVYTLAVSVVNFVRAGFARDLAACYPFENYFLGLAKGGFKHRISCNWWIVADCTFGRSDRVQENTRMNNLPASSAAGLELFRAQPLCCPSRVLILRPVPPLLLQQATSSTSAEDDGYYYRYYHHRCRCCYYY